jgi:predicted Zn finger-like uncharacterized protein
MSYLLLACPKCHAAYKIVKEAAESEVACRACGHRWVPASLMKPAAASEAATAPSAPPAFPPPAPAAEAAPAAASVQAPAPAVEPPPTPPAAPPKPAAPSGNPAGALEAMAQAAAARKGSGKTTEARLEAALPKAVPGDALAALANATKPRTAKPGDPVAAMAKAVQPSVQDRLAAKEAEAPPPAPAPQPQAAAPPKAAGEPADSLVGTSINGFKIIKRIGSGGFGVVYHAFDTSLERSVAIKMLPPRIAKASKGLLDRFLREARSAAKLSHPNIVTIHQICPYKDTFYIVMELVEGGALHEHLVQQRRFEPAEATRIIRAAAEGLGHAHRRGIIHRDIKPGNIMLTNDGQVKVSDFGLARDVLQGRDIVGPGHSLGTPRYMAPEQALGDEPTASSDLYSLAATYYALLTGRAPFDAPSDRELMKKHVTEDVPDPRQFVPELPVSAFRFFERTMAKQPDDRYLTAEEFVEALDRLNFSQAGASGPVTSQALSAQIGRIAPEERGSHLTEALGRAVKRAQRERTPTPGQRMAAVERAATAPKKKRSWLIWLIIGVVVLVVIAGAIVAAYVLAGRAKDAIVEGAKNVIQQGTSPAQPGQPVTPGAQQPAAQPAAGQPATRPVAPTEALSPLEDAARQAFEAVKKVEADPKVPREDVIQLYEENVLGIKAYAKTKAAEDARKAVARLQGASSEKPAENPKGN